MKKRFAFLMAVAMMLSLLVGCGSKGQDNSDGSSTQGTAGSVTLKLTHNAADGQAISDACIQLKNEIEEKTEGRVKIDIYGNNILGSETETRDIPRRTGRHPDECWYHYPARWHCYVRCQQEYRYTHRAIHKDHASMVSAYYRVPADFGIYTSDRDHFAAAYLRINNVKPLAK